MTKIVKSSYFLLNCEYIFLRCPNLAKWHKFWILQNDAAFLRICGFGSYLVLETVKLLIFAVFFLILTIFPTSKTRSRPKTQDLKNRCLSIGTIRKLHQLAKFGYSKCYKSQEVGQNYNSQFEKKLLFFRSFGKIAPHLGLKNGEE